MKIYPRIYSEAIREHFAKYRQMIFLSGPRQVGKTTLVREQNPKYISWDREKDRQLILSGADRIAEKFGLGSRMTEDRIIIAFDEIHRYPRWKTFIKGFFDSYEHDVKVMATGSARMDVYKRGGDSMMGRYFPYRVHPFSVAEIIRPSLPDESLIRSPAEIHEEDWTALWEHGGFPEPFTLRDRRFSRKWRDLRLEQLLRSDVRDISKTLEIDRIECLAKILINRSSEQLVYSSLARDLNVAEPTIKLWISILKSLYFGFEVRPWFRNVENSIRKTPKWFLRDWSAVEDDGKRAETLVACHLLKAVEMWTDLGYGEFALNYLRDKRKREVDFIVSRDSSPWFLVEVKKGDAKLSGALSEFQRMTGAKHAFQVVLDGAFVNRSCFDYTSPVVVSARTFLGQLV